MSPLAAFAPAWIGFEVLQLVLAERLLGLKQIQAGVDPRESSPSELISFLWAASILLYWAWMALMLYSRVGVTQMLALIAVTIVGYTIRRSCGLKWVLVALTFEGAIRIGMLVSLSVILWRSFG